MSRRAVVRAPKKDEIERAAEIAQIAFRTEESWIKGYNWLADNCGLEYLVVVEVNGELVASLVCSPEPVRFGDDTVPFSAVGAVGTLPEHRRHGYAGMMMEEAVKVLYRNGHHTSALWPFSFEYYRKFGWELSSENRLYRISPDLASQLASPDGVRPALKSDVPAISRLVNRFARRYNCISVRDDVWWSGYDSIYGFVFDENEDLRTSKSPWVHETDGEIDGYAYYQITGEGDQAVTDIKELVADTPIARKAILSRFAAAQTSSIVFNTPVDDTFLQELPDPRAVKVEIQPGFQFRVINPPAALEQRTVDPRLSGRIGFAITDPVFKSFEFSVEVSGGNIISSSIEAEECLSMSVQTFSQLYSGYMRPQRAVELGRIEPTSQHAVNFAEKLFPKTLPYRSMIELG